MASRVATFLESDAIMGALAEGGIYTRDIRRTGPDALPQAFGTAGRRLPALCIVEGPEAPMVFGSPAGYVRPLYIMAIADTSDHGHDAIDAMVGRAVATLYRWQDPVTGAVMGNGGNTGRLDDEDGSMNRLTMNVSGIHPVENW